MDTALDYNICMWDISLSEASLHCSFSKIIVLCTLLPTVSFCRGQKTTFWTLQGKSSLLPTFFEQSTLQCEISKTQCSDSHINSLNCFGRHQREIPKEEGQKQAVSAFAIEAKFSFSLRGRLPFSSELCTLNLQSSQSLTIKGIYKITSTRTDSKRNNSHL